MAWLSVNEVAHPVGSIVVTNTNQSPANELGGTWTRIDKKFKELGNVVTSTLGSGASSFTCQILRSDHNIRFRISFVPKSTLNDTTITVGTVDLQSCGLNDTTYYGGFYLPAGCDEAGGYAMCNFGWDTGTVQVVDAVGKNAGTLSGGYTYYLDFTIAVADTMMLDSHCKEWHWKRTA